MSRALSQYKIAWVGDTDAGAKYRQGSNGDYYAVLRQTAGTTSSLAELAFISNAPEADLLARPDFDAVEGQAVARGILPRAPRVEAITTAEYPTAARRPAYSCLDVRRLQCDAGLQLPAWQDGLASVMDAVRGH